MKLYKSTYMKLKISKPSDAKEGYLLKGDRDSKQDNGGYVIMLYFLIWLLITWVNSVMKTNLSVQLFLYLSECKYNYIKYCTYHALIETLL